MKNRKRRLEYISFYNHTGLERHFEQMARKGWMIESISNFFWVYRRIEPQEMHFCVSYYPRASDFDPSPSEEQQTFHDFCAHTGWKLACTWFQMQVFYNEQSSPIPLDTDPVMEVDVLHRACKKNFLPSHYLLLALGLLMGIQFIGEVCVAPIGVLSNASRLVTGVAYLCMLAISTTELATYFIWHRKAKQDALDGTFVETPSTTKFQIGIMAVLMAAVVLWLVNLFTADDPMLAWVAAVMLFGLFGVMLLVNGIKQGLKRIKASRGLNLFLTLAACFILPTALIGAVIHAGISANRNGLFDRDPAAMEHIPLSVSDFMETDQEKYIQTNRNNRTFLVGQQTVQIYPDWKQEGFGELPSIDYTVTTVNIPALYGWCKEQVYWEMDESRDSEIPSGHRNVLKQQDPAPWGAAEAYRVYNEEGWWLNRYLICYEESIIELRFDWEPTAADMAIAAEKLKP